VGLVIRGIMFGFLGIILIEPNTISHGTDPPQEKKIIKYFKLFLI
jgi:hypothetical protein